MPSPPGIRGTLKFMVVGCRRASVKYSSSTRPLPRPFPFHLLLSSLLPFPFLLLPLLSLSPPFSPLFLSLPFLFPFLGVPSTHPKQLGSLGML